MQQRRLRPGDVLDDYCPRERRVTDHAIVAMIDDEIKQTRCVSCDTEHEYKQARVPPQRRKKAPPALFTQVLDGLQGPARLAQGASGGSPGDEHVDGETEAPPGTPTPPAAPTPPDQERIAREVDLPDDDSAAAEPPSAPAQSQTPEPPDGEARVQEEGPVRRPLIRAQLPRHEGQPPPARELPDFTIRQPTNGRGTNRPGGHAARPGSGRRRPGGGHQGPSSGQTRFGGGHGRGDQFGRSGERRQGAGHGHGQGQGHGHGQGQGQGQGRGGRPNRGGRRGGGGGKKH